jgi:leucyl aminopeptidase (aminopeptidase T)
VVTDPQCKAVAEALVEGARRTGAEAVLVEMAQRVNHGNEPPPPVAAALLACDVFIGATTMSLSHTEARNAASKAGIRGATLPGITGEMLARTMGADYEEVRRASRALAERLTAADSVQITSDAGTDVVIGIKDRTGRPDDGDLGAPGAFGNLPAGEGFVAPVEGSTNGRIVFDGSMAGVGILQEPLVATITDGFATSFEGAAAEEFERIISPHGRNAYAVAELGIGTNAAATLTGETLEDEKIVGTIHVAFGDNHGFGGNIRVPSHHDGIVMNPTVTIGDEIVLRDGQLLV